MESKAEAFDITKAVPVNVSVNYSIPTRFKVNLHVITWI
jgi:hypothetical protein